MTEDYLIRGGANVVKTKYGEMMDISIHMDELVELYKVHKEFNKDKSDDEQKVWVHITVRDAKSGKKFLKFNDYPLTGESQKNKKSKSAAEPEDAEDDLPF